MKVLDASLVEALAMPDAPVTDAALRDVAALADELPAVLGPDVMAARPVFANTDRAGTVFGAASALEWVLRHPSNDTMLEPMDERAERELMATIASMGDDARTGPLARAWIAPRWGRLLPEVEPFSKASPVNTANTANTAVTASGSNPPRVYVPQATDLEALEGLDEEPGRWSFHVFDDVPGDAVFRRFPGCAWTFELPLLGPDHALALLRRSDLHGWLRCALLGIGARTGLPATERALAMQVRDAAAASGREAQTAAVRQVGERLGPLARRIASATGARIDPRHPLWGARRNESDDPALSATDQGAGLPQKLRVAPRTIGLLVRAEVESWGIRDQDDVQRITDHLVEELRKELAPGHDLDGARLYVMAARRFDLVGLAEAH